MTQRRLVRDDIAYMLPMLVFLGFVQIGVWWKSLFPYCYVARAFIVPVLLVILWRNYTKIRWNGWWLGAILGVVGIVQWVGMQLLLRKISFHTHDGVWKPFEPSADAFNPTAFFHSPISMWAWITIRIASAALVVPVMEELFWRDFVWRTIIAPADFKLARVGEWSAVAFFGTVCAFSVPHGDCWLTAIVWGLMIGALLLHTKSLGACIIMHGTTNLLLGFYILHTHDWALW